jgi:GNAT superfamily N-acetyltransferase/predicted GNAT family acetyltransferase
MYRYTRLHAANVSRFTSLTLDAYRTALTQLPEHQLAIGAFYLWQPVGLILISRSPDRKRAEVLSLSVISPHRGHGVASGLLAEAEHILAEEGFEQIDLRYTTNLDQVSALEHILQKRGWSPPITLRIVCETDVTRYVNGPLYTFQAPLPEGYEIFAWKALSPLERESILQRHASTPGGWFPEEVSPFAQEEIVEPINSLGLRFNGQVVGWLVSHRVSPSTIYYAEAFIAREHKGHGFGLMLAAESSRAHVDHILKTGEASRAFCHLMPASKWTALFTEMAKTNDSFKVFEFRASSCVLYNRLHAPLPIMPAEIPEHFLRG